MTQLKNTIESLLFSAGKRLSVEELSRLCKEENQDAIRAALIVLQKELDDKNSSLMLVQEGDGWKLTVREQYIHVVKKVVKAPEMPKSILETLAVVAYKAPVMQSQVIKIRTNKAYRHLDELEELGYLTREKKGRSRLIKLTPKFFDYFDVPPEKLKEKFANVTALEKAIEGKEQASQQAQKAIITASKDKTPVVETITDELPKLAPEIEVLGGKVGGLETYGQAQQKKKPKRHKAKEKTEQAAEEIAEKILEEGMTEEGRLTVEKIKQEAAKKKPRKTAYEPKGLYPQGMPPEVAEKVEHRVKEITQGGQEEEKTEETAEVPETIPAPPEEKEEE
jgi:segregation and condensation protein B